MDGPTCIFWANLTPFVLQDAAAGGPARWGYDVLVASHSWSELPLETFTLYLDALARRATYILYCTQVRPGASLVCVWSYRVRSLEKYERFPLKLSKVVPITPNAS